MTENLRRQAGHLMAGMRYGEALPVVREVLSRDPDASDMVFALAVILDASGGLDASRNTFERALPLAPGHARILTQFGLSLHREGHFTQAMRRFFEACTNDPDCHDAYAGLALCQRDLGAFEKAEANLRSAFMAMGRVTGRHARDSNSVDAPIFEQRVLGANLWMETAMFAAMFISGEDGITRVAIPTAESATEELRNRRFGGLFYRDHWESLGSQREFLPNFFDSVREWLVELPSYPGICLAMASVLLRLDRAAEAAEYREEAEAFKVASPLDPTRS